MISSKEKKRRKNKRELKSLKNKMGVNLIWFNSLSTQKQFDILFLWKKEKYKNKLQSPVWTITTRLVPIDSSRPWGRKKPKKEKILKYPSSLKHFISKCRQNPQFRPNINSVRDLTIDVILKKK